MAPTLAAPGASPADGHRSRAVAVDPFLASPEIDGGGAAADLSRSARNARVSIRPDPRAWIAHFARTRLLYVELSKDRPATFQFR